jgi:hypothetical protein
VKGPSSSSSSSSLTCFSTIIKDQIYIIPDLRLSLSLYRIHRDNNQHGLVALPEWQPIRQQLNYARTIEFNQSESGA